VTAPGIGWINGYSIASEIGDIQRFSTPTKLVGYTGLCPRVKQSGDMDARRPLSKHGPRYLRWGLMEAALNAHDHPVFAELSGHPAPAGSPARSQGRADRPGAPAD
jgi:transposase